MSCAGARLLFAAWLHALPKGPFGANLAKPTNFGTRRTPSLGPICRCQALVPVPADLLRVLPAE
jgi:hypothetical protein